MPPSAEARGLCLTPLMPRICACVWQVTSVVIKFNAQISSISTHSVTGEGGAGNWNSAVDGVTASFAGQSTGSNSEVDQRQFSMTVTVTASQAQLPSGLAKLLDILEEAVTQGIQG